MSTTAPNPPPAPQVDPIDKYSAFIVRGTILGGVGLGLALFVRNSRLFATYQHVKQIPEDFYRLGIEMKGVVREVTPSGWIRVEHQPYIKLPKMLRMRRTPKTQGNLNLRLAGIEVSPVGVQHLTKEMKLVGRPVAFSVVKPVEQEPDASDADVNAKKAMRRVNLNTELVRKGYARVYGPNDSAHMKALQTNRHYSRLITRLLTCEKVAEARGLGVWERSTWVEKVASLPSTVAQIVRHSTVTKVIVLTFYMLHDTALALYSFAKNIYYICLALGQYTVDGYRRFSRAIDRLSGWYFGAKRNGAPKAIGNGQKSG